MKKVLFTALFIVSLSACASASGWLKDSSGKNGVVVAPVDKFLKTINASCRAMVCDYEGAILSSNHVFDNTVINVDGAEWICNLKTSKVKGAKDALDLYFTFTLSSGSAKSSGAAVAFDFNKWGKDNYLMIPASVYNGNRNRIVKREYAQGLDRSDLYRKDLPLTTASVPQLSPNDGESSRLEVNVSNTTTPAVCVFDRTSNKAFILLAEQGIEVDGNVIDNAFIVEESADRKSASVVVSAPGVRELKPEFVGFSKSPDRAIDMKQGDKIAIRLRIFAFDAADVTGLLERFMSVRKDVTGENAPRNLIPASKTIELMANNINSRFYKGDLAEFYCPENANWISFGWIGGLMNTFPMIALGDEFHRKRVASTFDFALPRAQGDAGYVYGALDFDGRLFGREGYDEFPEITLTRKNSDVLFWMIKQLMLLKEQGHSSSINPQWEESMKRMADAFVNTWKKDGQWGNFVNINTGDVAVYNTTSGAMTPGALALASVYFSNSEYLDIAKAAADEYYNNHFVKYGMTTGGCADILQNADSETAIALTTSLMALYEITGDKSWLEKSRNVANLCSTWTVSFDYVLPSDTPLAKLGAKLTGAVWASTQNKHGAPGFCTSSGDPLFKIYRETADKRYAELMYDIIHAHAEGIQPNGRITERLTYCDADSRGSRGDGGRTGWNELNGALMAMEIPGIYLRKDCDMMYVFDHVNVKNIYRGKDGVTMEIFNPTQHDAEVSILAESKDDLKNPIGYTNFIKWPKVKVPAGTTITYTCK